MPTIDLDRTFNLLESQDSKRLVDLCLGVRDVPWKALYPDEIHVVLITYRFLEWLCERGLVEFTTPPEDRKIPSRIPDFTFRRIRVEHEECISSILDEFKWSQRHRGLGMRDRDLRAVS